MGLYPEQNTVCVTSSSVAVIFVLRVLFLEEPTMTKPTFIFLKNEGFDIFIFKVVLKK